MTPRHPEIDLESGGGPSTHHISTLQLLLRAAHSTELNEQHRAALQLSKLVDSFGPLPAVSFGPLVHALCRLLPSEDTNVARFSARTLKTLLLDDVMRPQAISSGITTIVVEAIQRWKHDRDMLVCCELLACLQTLVYDRSAVAIAVEEKCTPLLLELLLSENPEVATLSMTSLANILSHADSVLLAQESWAQQVAASIDTVLEIASTSHEKGLRCYAVAAIANATAHPILAGRIAELNGLAIMREIEGKSLTLEGTRVAECAETARLRLAALEVKSNQGQDIALRKYSFKWGNAPIMELIFDPQTNRNRLQVCAVVWVLTVVLLFYPLVFSHRATIRLRKHP